MQKSFIFPSVFEENYREFEKVADTFLEAIKIINFRDKDYIVGELALKEGNAPHKFLNSSANDLDYQLLGSLGLLIATQGSYSKLIVTTGFPFTTYQPYKKEATDFLKGLHEISFDSGLLGGQGIETVRLTVSEADVLLFSALFWDTLVKHCKSIYICYFWVSRNNMICLFELRKTLLEVLAYR